MARYIDAEKAVMTALSLTRLYDSDYQRGFYDGMDRTLEIIADEPTADVAEVKRGEWIGYSTEAYTGADDYGEPRWANRRYYRCSRCRTGTVVRSNYCPNCGALDKQEG